MWSWFSSLDPRLSAALIAGVIALLTSVLTTVVTAAIALFTPLGGYLVAKFQLRDKLRTEYEYEQRKKLRDLIGRYHGRVLQAAEDTNYRIRNLYANESRGWLNVDTDYSKVGANSRKYYFHTTVYRFLTLMAIIRRFEGEALYVDSRIAQESDFAFLKYLRAIMWVMTDAKLFDQLTYDEHKARDHLFRDSLKRACDYCWTSDGDRFLLLDELRAKMGEQEAFDSVLCFFNGLQRSEQGRYRWDRLVALHLLLLAFIRDFGHQFQRSTPEDINEIVKEFENPEVPENLLRWLPKLGLDQQGSMCEVGKALTDVTRKDKTEQPRTPQSAPGEPLQS